MQRFVYLCFGLVLGCSKGESIETSQSPGSTTTSSHSYATDFAATEDPISEGGRWVNGGSIGLDWTNVSTTPRRAIGHQVSASYTDATALLNGTWGPNQRATAVVFANGALSDECYSEVELRLRSTIASHSNRGYEVSFKVSDAGSAYLIIVRWNGKLGDFTYLSRYDGAQYGVHNGDVVSATIAGGIIVAYKNGVEAGRATDNTFTSGSPGMGFNLENAKPGCAGTNDRYGFSAFSATDSLGT